MTRIGIIGTRHANAGTYRPRHITHLAILITCLVAADAVPAVAASTDRIGSADISILELTLPGNTAGKATPALRLVIPARDRPADSRGAAVALLGASPVAALQVLADPGGAFGTISTALAEFFPASPIHIAGVIAGAFGDVIPVLDAYTITAGTVVTGRHTSLITTDPVLAVPAQAVCRATAGLPGVALALARAVAHRRGVAGVGILAVEHRQAQPLVARLVAGHATGGAGRVAAEAVLAEAAHALVP